MDSFSRLRNRVLWTQFLCMQNHRFPSLSLPSQQHQFATSKAEFVQQQNSDIGIQLLANEIDNNVDEAVLKHPSPTTATKARGSDGDGSSRRQCRQRSDRVGMRVWEWERARLREWEGETESEREWDNVTVCLKFELSFFCVFGFFVCLKCFFEWCLRWFPLKQTEFNELGLQE